MVLKTVTEFSKYIKKTTILKIKTFLHKMYIILPEIQKYPLS